MNVGTAAISYSPIYIVHRATHGPVLNKIIPDLFGINGDIILLMIIMIMVLVMAAFIIKFLNEAHELNVQLEKEMEYSKKVERDNQAWHDRVEVLKIRTEKMRKKLESYEKYAQDMAARQEYLESQIRLHGSPSEEYGTPQATYGDYADIEVYQHYEELPMAGSDAAPVGPTMEEDEEAASPILSAIKAIEIPPPPWERDRTGYEFVIQDVFVIYKDGRLISHLSKKIRIIDDSQIIGSMITAVQMCVRESFKRESRGSLGAMKFGDISILMENGEFLNLAVVLRGANYDILKDAMRDTLKTIHEAWSKELEAWDGTLTNIGALEKIIQRDLIERFDTEVFHKPENVTLDLSKAKVFRPTEDPG